MSSSSLWTTTRSVSAVVAGVGEVAGRTASWAAAEFAMANRAAEVIRNFFMNKFFESHWCEIRVAAALAGRDRNGSVSVHGIRAAGRATNRNAETPRENAARACARREWAARAREGAR